MNDTLKIARDDRGVVTLTLNLPNSRNAMSGQMITELTAFASAMQNDEARIVVLQGAGKVFCAGGDLNWMKDQMKADRATRIKGAGQLAYMLKALNELPQFVIANVHGGAYGGGVGLLSVCDYVIAQTDTKFALSETRLGIIPATISPYVMARIGEAAARRVILSSRIFTAHEAQAMDLVADIADDETTAQNILQAQITASLTTAPQAVTAAKKLIRQLGSPITDEIIHQNITALADIWETKQARQRIDDFLASR